MEFKRNKLKSITLYVVSLTIYLIGIFIFRNLLTQLHYYYLFATIPLLFLFVSMSICDAIKLFLNICSLVFGRHDNDEINDFIENCISFMIRLSKYILIGIFTALLSSVMILDIIVCVNYDKYVLVAISIVVWILLYYMLFANIVKMIKKEIRL